MNEVTAGAEHHEDVVRELRELQRHVQSLLQTAKGFFFYRAAIEPGNPLKVSVIMVSPSITDMTGIQDVDNFESWFANIHPDDKPKVVEANQHSIATGTPYDQVARWYHPVRCEWIWVRTLSQPVYNSEGVITHFNGICIDITQQKQAEEALKESESRFRSLIENAPEAIFVQSEGRCLYMNPAMLKLLGASKEEEMLGGDMFARVAPEYHDIIRERARQQRLSGAAAPLLEIESLKLDGTRIPVETTSVAILFQNRYAQLVFVRDITDRKQAGQALRQSEEQYRTLFDHMLNGIMVCEVICDEAGVPYDHRFVHGNPEFERQTGYKVNDLVGKTSKELAIGWPPEVRQRLYKVAMTGEPIEYERYNETIGRFYETRVISPRRGQFAHVFSEITERKRIEKALHEKNAALDQSVTQLRKLAMELTRAEERERKRLATKLHDDVQQWLVAATMKISLLNQSSSDEERNRMVQEAQHLVGEALNATRSLTTDLYPPVLRDGGFLPGLRWLANRMRETHDLTVAVIGEEVQAVPEPLSILLFMGVRELLFNVVKHADVKTARVVVARPDANTMQVEVSDGGIGFAGNKTSRGLGMFHLRERLACVGGSLDVASVPGQGTRVSITVPLG